MITYFVPAFMSTALCIASKSNSNSDLPKIIRSIEGNGSSFHPATKVENDIKPQSQALVVHFDINETILVGDNAGGDTQEDSLNKILAKSAFVKIPPGSDKSLGKSMDKDSDSITPTHWWDGSVIGEGNTHAPPLYTGWKWPDGCCPYYRTIYKRRSKKFVYGHGQPYRQLYDSIQKELTFHHSTQEGVKLPDVMPHLLPALFDTLNVLSQRPEQNIRLVFRTFGTDLPQIAEAVTAFSRGLTLNFHKPLFSKDDGAMESTFYFNMMMIILKALS
jgi:hypothetical protein